MRIKNSWQGIPGYWYDDAASPDGKRWIATREGWKRIQEKVRGLASGRCELRTSANCIGVSLSLDIHHRLGRGMGGGKREDRIFVVGVRILKACCRPCHDQAKIETKEEVFGCKS
jgi:hypothetical protein